MNRQQLALKQMTKYGLLILCVFALYVLQSVPGFLSVFGVKPTLLIPFCINLAMLDDEPYTIFVFVIAGLLFELSAGRVIGLYTIPLLLACVIANIAAKFFFKPNYRNTVLLALIATFCILSIDFFFNYVLMRYKGIGGIYFKTVILSSVYSMVFSVLYYKVIYKICDKFKSFYAR